MNEKNKKIVIIISKWRRNIIDIGRINYEIWNIASEDTFLPQEYEDTRL